MFYCWLCWNEVDVLAEVEFVPCIDCPLFWMYEIYEEVM